MSENNRRSGGADRSSLENWQSIEDPAERRRVQNRLAQRKFRSKKKDKEEEVARVAESQRAAGGAYTAAEPKDLRHNEDPNGLPWGSYSMKHVIESSRAASSQSQQARTGSAAENSTTASGSADRGTSGRQ